MNTMKTLFLTSILALCPVILRAQVGVSVAPTKTGTTQSPGDNTTALATDAFVVANVPTLAHGGCVSDLSGTGGAHFVLRQITVGGNCQVVPLNGLASLTSATGNIANTETVVTSFSILGNTFTAGTTIRIQIEGTCTTSTAPGLATFRVRVGPTTLTGTIVGISTPTLLPSVTSKHILVQAWLPIRSIVTTTATIDADSITIADVLLVAATPVFGGSSGSTFNPTVTNLVELTYQSGNSTSSCTFFTSLLEIALL
jgi:hypothetical protein